MKKHLILLILVAISFNCCFMQSKDIMKNYSEQKERLDLYLKAVKKNELNIVKEEDFYSIDRTIFGKNLLVIFVEQIIIPNEIEKTYFEAKVLEFFKNTKKIDLFLKYYKFDSNGNKYVLRRDNEFDELLFTNLFKILNKNAEALKDDSVSVFFAYPIYAKHKNYMYNLNIKENEKNVDDYYLYFSNYKVQFFQYQAFVVEKILEVNGNKFKIYFLFET